MTQKQRKFKELILQGKNGTQAALEAGYASKSSRVSAHRNITNDNIKAELNKGYARIEKKTDITVQFIQSEHKRLQALAEARQDLTVATQNLTGLGKTINAYKDSDLNVNQQSPAPIPADELAELNRRAMIMTDIKLAKNTG